MPPKDPFNSLLSLGYTLILYEIYGEVCNRGLNPYIGFMHKDRERHPTLASDLLEEWRAIIVDSTVLSLIQGNEISIDNFWTDDETGGVFLDREGMKIFINKIEGKMKTEMSYIKNENRISFRRAIWHQVGELARAIETENPEVYEPIKAR